MAKAGSMLKKSLISLLQKALRILGHSWDSWAFWAFLNILGILGHSWDSA
jgi:hypothetical protein